jgi:hypothetical protein
VGHDGCQHVGFGDFGAAGVEGRVAGGGEVLHHDLAEAGAGGGALGGSAIFFQVVGGGGDEYGWCVGFRGMVFMLADDEG